MPIISESEMIAPGAILARGEYRIKDKIQSTDEYIEILCCGGKLLLQGEIVDVNVAARKPMMLIAAIIDKGEAYTIEPLPGIFARWYAMNEGTDANT